MSEVIQYKQAVNSKNTMKKYLYYIVDSKKNYIYDTAMLCPILSYNKKIREIIEFADCKNDMFTIDEDYLEIICAKYLSNYMDWWTRYFYTLNI